MPVHVFSTACDVISFNDQGQLCPLTCAEWRDLSNHTRMSTIQSRTPEKKAKNHLREWSLTIGGRAAIFWVAIWGGLKFSEPPFMGGLQFSGHLWAMCAY